MADPKRACKVRHAPQERGSVFNLKLKNMKSLKLNQLDSQRLAEKEMLNVTGGQGGWRYDIGPNGTYTRYCTCGCAYENNGGSSTEDNNNANYSGGTSGLRTPGFPLTPNSK